MSKTQFVHPDGSHVNSPSRDWAADQLTAATPEYWLSGGSGEVTISSGAGAIMSVKYLPDEGYFVILTEPKEDWLVPYSGGSCERLIEDEYGGDPFWIPRGCLVDLSQATAAVRAFVAGAEPAPAIRWTRWGELPLPADYPEP